MGGRVTESQQAHVCTAISAVISALTAVIFLQAAVGRLREVTAAVQELKATQVHTGTEEAQPSDAAFSHRADLIINACGDLSQQVNATLVRWK